LKNPLLFLLVSALLVQASIFGTSRLCDKAFDQAVASTSVHQSHNKNTTYHPSPAKHFDASDCEASCAASVMSLVPETPALTRVEPLRRGWMARHDRDVDALYKVALPPPDAA
jgi:hypothetical protein